MKELSIEEKAKSYDGLIERLKDLKFAYRFSPLSDTIEDIFPELVESEDEKIRKRICKLLWDNAPYEEAQEYITWLEKQGEQKSESKIALEAIKEEKVDNQNCVKSYTQEHIGDNVELKFKVGDWIIFNGLILHIDEIVDGYYYRTTSIGGIPNSYNWNIDNTARLWTIQDAKEGDVLFQDLMGGKTFIYNGVNSDMAILYSFIISNDGEDVLPYHIGKPNTGIGYIEENKNIIHPATKEQRDTLMKVMADAGYTFDFEKKELKKIEQSPINVRTTGYCHAKDVEQNPAWSEKDNEIIEEIINDIECARAINYHTPKEDYEFRENWLESLKYRVQPQQEWSEENEGIYRSIMYSFAHNYPLTIQQQEFVKSIKERYIWKPSEEQMRVLDLAIKCGINRGTTEETTLVSLFNDLKRLNMNN